MKESYSRLLKSSSFGTFRQTCPHAFLANAFFMKHPSVVPVWQFGFYDEQTDTLTSFSMEEPVAVKANQEIFKDSNRALLELNLDSINIMESGAVQSALLAAASMSKDKPQVSTTIVVLQEDPALGALWTVTFVTAQFSTITVKIDAKTGEIKQKTQDSLLSLGKIEKGLKGV